MSPVAKTGLPSREAAAEPPSINSATPVSPPNSWAWGLPELVPPTVCPEPCLGDNARGPKDEPWPTAPESPVGAGARLLLGLSCARNVPKMGPNTGSSHRKGLREPPSRGRSGAAPLPPSVGAPEALATAWAAAEERPDGPPPSGRETWLLPKTGRCKGRPLDGTLRPASPDLLPTCGPAGPLPFPPLPPRPPGPPTAALSVLEL
mmetsp:Transcript_30220/g.77289  ORF Transcript_30220/g.77289 Transcript_30220/m.77289 type:complete len:205 (-) Transcript_30220:161-775(-)